MDVAQQGLMVAGALLVLGLAGYGARLLWLLRRQSRIRSGQRARRDAERAERARGIRESIALLARAMLQGQVSATEAAIRISTLAGGLGPDAPERDQLRAFEALALAASHIPILAAWQALSSAERDRFDAERESLEEAHRAALEAAARGLVASARFPG